MKKLFSIISLFFIAIATFIFTPVIHTNAYGGDLDFIDSYIIQIDPVKEDGSLNIDISISWRVLDSSSDGPMDWVKIGVPNRYVSNITPKTDNIQKIKYYSEDGSFIAVYFNKKYYANEVCNFEFSFNQQRMYHLNDDDTMYYHYANGYFDNIVVQDCIILWNKDGVEEINDTSILYKGLDETGNYHKFESALGHSQQIAVQTHYKKDYFVTLDEKMQYTDAYMTAKDKAMIIIIIFIVVFFILLCIYASYKSQDPYMVDRGFTGRPHFFYYGFYHHHHYYSAGFDKKGGRIINPTPPGGSGHSSGSGSHCACACACACAGGGRAGCSKKDFYSAKINTKKLLEKL